MPDRSKGRGQTKCSPRSFRLGFGHGPNNPAPEKSTVTKPQEPMEEDHGGGQDPHRVVASVKKKKSISHKICRVCCLKKIVLIQIVLS
jgi:hypothetical protein